MAKISSLPVGLSNAPVVIIPGDTVFFGPRAPDKPQSVEDLEARMAAIREEIKEEKSR